MTPRKAGVLALLLTLLMVGAAVVAVQAGGSSQQARSLVGETDPALIAPDRAPDVPPLQAAGWFQSPPLTPATLRGRVALIDFWDASCINCRRTFPFLARLQQTYAAAGLVVVGVHSPEFAFEKPQAYVERSARELGVTWAVANDPEMAIWSSFHNQYWPAEYLVDRNGRVRLFHAGEGDEAAIEKAVRALLDEGGQAGAAHVGAVPTGEPPVTAAGGITAERYLGADRGASSYSTGVVVGVGTTVARQDGAPKADHVALAGSFTGAGDSVAGAPDASVSLRFHAREVYAVLAPPPGGGDVEVLLDGFPVPAERRGPALRVLPSGATVAHVGQEDLFHLVTAPAGSTGGGLLTLTTRTQGLRYFTFTFGG